MKQQSPILPMKRIELWFSVASIWEMGIKVAIGKLPLADPLDSYIFSWMAGYAYAFAISAIAFATSETTFAISVMTPAHCVHPQTTD